MRYIFDWDPAKAKENAAKHDVSFEQAAVIFLDTRAISILDKEHSDKEERWITVGMDKTGTLLVAVHTFEEINMEECKVRMISARSATKKESRQYAEENP